MSEKNLSRRMEIRSATPEEIREELGLPSDATQAEVVAERRRLFDESAEEFVDIEARADSGDTDAA